MEEREGVRGDGTGLKRARGGVEGGDGAVEAADSSEVPVVHGRREAATTWAGGPSGFLPSRSV